MSPLGDTTKKTKAASAMDEKQYAQWKYDEALKKMLEIPTQDNIDAFTEANKHLYETLDAYRLGMKLLLEKANHLKNAILILLKR